jgi:hypothetical protein
MGGSGSNVYFNARAWVRQREVVKIKMADVKCRQKLLADGAAVTAGPGKPNPAAKTVTLLPRRTSTYGEETDSVHVYDTCDEIRRKVNAQLKTAGLTQTSSAGTCTRS